MTRFIGSRRSLFGVVSSGDAPEITVNAVDFDATNDYLTRGANLTNIADGNTTLCSCWFRVDAGNGTVRVIFNDKAVTVTYFLELTSGNLLEFGARDSAGTSIFHLRSTQQFLSGFSWHHFIGSFNTTSGTAQMYINDLSDINIITDNRPFTIPYATRTDWVFGAYNTGATFKWAGCVSEFWFGANQSLDLSVESNRRKFISNNLLPVDLGTDGSRPLGVTPTVYFKGVGDAWATNAGSGGNFSVVGALDVCSDAPSTYLAPAVDFGGTTEWLTRGANFTGISDSFVYSFSVWFRVDAGDGTVRVLLNDKAVTVRQFMELDSSNRLEFGVRDSAGTSIFHIRTTETFTAGATWHHACGSLNSSTAAFTLYIDDVVTGGGIVTNQTPFTIPFSTTITDWVVGAYNTGGSLRWNGCISEMWVSFGQYVDFSDTATRRKFITAGLKPVPLAHDGSLPTGTSPRLYLRNHAYTYGTNSGTGGDLTVSGTIVDASTSPSN